MKHCFILGTRPEIIKLSSCIRYCVRHWLDFFVIHTGQHYSANMDRLFFEELELPEPRYQLWAGGGSHAEMTGRMMAGIERILLDERPDRVYVQGDTNSVLAGALAAAKIGVAVAHVEAGLRSYDRSMPEEINRVVADAVSEYLFCPTERQRDILMGEWIAPERISVVGNTISDAVLDADEASVHMAPGVLAGFGLEPDRYILLTAHRPANVDDRSALSGLLEGVANIARHSERRVFFPLHPRTAANLARFGLAGSLPAEFILSEPVGFRENILLQRHAYFVATDSGGVQEESCILRKKTLILRDNTERPETLDVGGALLAGHDPEHIFAAYETLRDREVRWINPFGSDVAEKIMRVTA